MKIVLLGGIGLKKKLSELYPYVEKLLVVYLRDQYSWSRLGILLSCVQLTKAMSYILYVGALAFVCIRSASFVKPNFSNVA